MNKNLFIAVFCFYTFSALAQSPDNQAKIASAIKNYFALDRENIHIHMNKNVYLSNETIWLKGYITEKKTGNPYASTSNVYVNLRDNDGKIVNTTLLFSENSLFEGYLKINETIPSGRYYLQAYTNFMNNFAEDESAVYEFNVINVNDTKIADYNTININTTSISLYPESGVFLEGVNNTIGIEVLDCNKNGIIVQNAKVLDANGTAITTFTTNSEGYGKFDIIATRSEIYKISFEAQGKQFEKAMPLPSLSGIAFTVNNYTFNDKALIQIKTNARTVKELGDKQLTFVIQQNDVAAFAPLSFANGKTEQVVSVPNQYISEGINTIHLIDDAMQKRGERIIFRPILSKNTSTIDLHQKRGDSLVLKGISQLTLASFSVSVLPGDTHAKLAKGIYGAFYFDSYVNTPVRNADYYLNDFTRKKHFELDNLLLSRKSKYSWESMMAAPAEKKYAFDNGLTVKGTVNGILANKADYLIKMTAPLYGIDESTTINEKNEFQFENVMAIDSSAVFFSLIDKKLKNTDLKLYSQLLNNNRKFMKNFTVPTAPCATTESIFTTVELPVIRDAISLAAINVEGKDKKKELSLENMSKFNNNLARGYKITEREASTYQDFLSFLQAHGYNVSKEGGTVAITRRYVSSFQGSNSPLIFMDDAPVVELLLLLNLNLNTVDEIYINPRGYGQGSGGGNGVIRIYTKKGHGSSGGTIKVKSQQLFVKNGFQAYKPFKNPEYVNLDDNGFKRFGTLAWIPNVSTDAGGNFSFSVPNLHQKSIKIIIEGITSNGELYSETKTLNIE